VVFGRDKGRKYATHESCARKKKNQIGLKTCRAVGNLNARTFLVPAPFPSCAYFPHTPLPDSREGKLGKLFAEWKTNLDEMAS